MKKRACIALAALMTVGVVASCGGAKGEKYDYELVVWAAEKAKNLTQTQANTWAESITDHKIKIRVAAVGEGEAASNMITDVEAGADLFCFAQDQLARLKSAGALSTIVDPTLKQEIIDANDEASITASKVGDDLVCYPLTSDNGYFMYYDKSVFTNPEDLEDLTTIIAKCQEAGKKLYFNCEDSAWYGASFMMANGCYSLWETNRAGKFTGYTDNYNSTAGKASLKAAYPLLTSEVFINGSDCNAAFTPDPTTGAISAAVCISGTWDYGYAKTALGENMGATDLPSVTINGESKHLGSFSGCKLLGVKPQTDPIKAAYATALARHLSSQASQLERFEALGWGPSNVAAQANEAVLAAPQLAAVNLQNQYAIPQGQYPGDWWTSAAAIMSSLKASDGSDAAIAKILKTYEATIDTYVNGEPDVD